jgi:hypothetical protein
VATWRGISRVRNADSGREHNNRISIYPSYREERDAMEKTQQYQTNLRELIEENGYTFKEISEETGISLSALFIYARGERPIPWKKEPSVIRLGIALKGNT